MPAEEFKVAPPRKAEHDAQHSMTHCANNKHSIESYMGEQLVVA